MRPGPQGGEEAGAVGIFGPVGGERQPSFFIGTALTGQFGTYAVENWLPSIAPISPRPRKSERRHRMRVDEIYLRHSLASGAEYFAEHPVLKDVAKIASTFRHMLSHSYID